MKLLIHSDCVETMAHAPSFYKECISMYTGCNFKSDTKLVFRAQLFVDSEALKHLLKLVR